MKTENLTDEQIDKLIHTRLLDLCEVCQMAMHSTHEDECVPFGSVPAYTSPDTPRKVLDAAVAKTEDEWGWSIEGYLFDLMPRELGDYRATPRQICEAIVSCLPEEYAAIHGMPYKGRQHGQELEAARNTLAEVDKDGQAPTTCGRE